MGQQGNTNRRANRKFLGRGVALSVIVFALSLVALALLLRSPIGSDQAEQGTAGNGSTGAEIDARTAERERARTERAAEDSLSDQVWLLRRTGQYREAAALAHQLLACFQTSPHRTRYEIEEVEWRLRALEKLAGLPAGARAAFFRSENEFDTTKEIRLEADWARSASAYASHLEVMRAVFGEHDPETVTFLSRQGNFLLNWGRYAEGEASYRRALVALERIVPEDHPAVADLYGSLAAAHYYQGRYDEAEPLYRRLLALRIRILGEIHTDVALIYSNLGMVLLAQGDNAGAEEALREACRIHWEVRGYDHETFMNNLATALTRTGKFAEAETLLVRASRINAAQYGPEDHSVAINLTNLARVRRAAGRLASADSLLGQAEEFLRRAAGTHHLDYARCRIDRSEIGLTLGSIEAEELRLKEAVAILRERSRGDLPEIARALLLLGRTQLSAGKTSEALGTLTEAAGSYDRLRLRAGSEFKRATVRLESPYPELARALLLEDQSEEAWNALERGKGRCLADLLARSDQRGLSAEERVREDSLRGALLVLENADQAAADPATATDSRIDRAGIRSRLLVAEAAWNEFEAELAERHGLTEGQPFSRERVQATLRPNEAVIGWLDGSPSERCSSTWGFVLRATGPVFWVGCPAPPEVSSGAASRPSYLNALARAGSWPLRVPFSSRLLTQAREIGEERIAPLLSHLEGVNHLIVVPSGGMLGFPIEAAALSDGSWLADHFTVSYVPSATIHAWLLSKASAHYRPSMDSRQVLLLGDPVFSTFAGSAAPKDEVRTASFESAPTRAAFPEMPRLPMSRAEVESLAAVFPEARILLGEQASEEALTHLAKSGELAGFRFLHFATHALVDDATPERSALALSRDDETDCVGSILSGDRVFDGQLTARELVREWRLAADLVTLSGCRTGLGRAAGGEGHLGLASAFFQAGARSLVVSLWKTDDHAAALFMSRFYRNIARRGLPKAEALREARSWLRTYRAVDGTLPFSHPAYWSAFVLLGDPR